MPSQNIPRGLIALITTERGLDREVEQFFRNIGGKVLPANVSIDELYSLFTNSGITEIDNGTEELKRNTLEAPTDLDDRAEELTRKTFEIKEEFHNITEGLERRIEAFYSEIEDLKQQIENLERSL